MAGRVRAISQVGIPVVAHIGLTPQRLNSLGGFKVQGKDANKVHISLLPSEVFLTKSEKAIDLVQDALELQEAGASMLVIEAVPSVVAQAITSMLSIPTIGIGAGGHCSGQVLVQQDMLGIFNNFVPK
jgi:3-methyl-2-oxobutanoate hydroxymethyltransferase